MDAWLTESLRIAGSVFLTFWLLEVLVLAVLGVCSGSRRLRDPPPADAMTDAGS